LPISPKDLDYAGEKIPPLESDRTRRLVTQRLTISGPVAALEKHEDAAQVLDSLRHVPDPQVKVGRNTCFKDGCFVDVVYQTPEAFRAFDLKTVFDAKSLFNRWSYGAGRTMLLRGPKKQLIATWYASNPSSYHEAKSAPKSEGGRK
jgi:hypothetical protein